MIEQGRSSERAQCDSVWCAEIVLKSAGLRISGGNSGGSGGARTRHEPNNDAAKTVSPSQVASQRRVKAGLDLSQVVTAWAKLPAALKAAILAIVRTAADSSKRTEDEP